jgi:hypothetical protein
MTLTGVSAVERWIWSRPDGRSGRSPRAIELVKQAVNRSALHRVVQVQHAVAVDHLVGIVEEHCVIGDAFARTEATLALATIAARWTLRPKPRNERWLAGLTHRPSWILIRSVSLRCSSFQVQNAAGATVDSGLRGSAAHLSVVVPGSAVRGYAPRRLVAAVRSGSTHLASRSR